MSARIVRPDDACDYDASLVIPLFNEHECVVPLLDAIAAGMADFEGTWEVILVDDGSVDQTLQVARQEIARRSFSLKVVELQRNFGQTAAMQAGIDASQGELIVTLDGDLQNDPADIPEMIQQLRERDLDLLVGRRAKRKDGLILRKIPSWIANRLIGRLTGVRLHDYGCSLKVYRSEVIRQVTLMGEMHRFIPAWVAGVVPASRIGEMPVRHHARQFGQSKYGISRTIRVFIDLMSVIFFMRYKARPGHLFGTLGISVGAVGALILLYLGVDKFILGNDIGTRPLLLVGVVCALSSLQLMTTAILAEMISRTYFQTSNNANYVVRELHEEQPDSGRMAA